MKGTRHTDTQGNNSNILLSKMLQTTIKLHSVRFSSQMYVVSSENRNVMLKRVQRYLAQKSNLQHTYKSGLWSKWITDYKKAILSGV